MTNEVTTSTARWLPFILGVVLLAVVASSPVYAHAGFDHIRGTVAKVSNDVLTIKTAEGNMDVRLDKQTDLTRNGQKAQVKDLKIGARVIVDLPKGGKDKVAHSVKIGALAKSSDQHAHGSPK
jgi:hypothetical protein